MKTNQPPNGKLSVRWLIENAPTEEILTGLLEEAVKIPANSKTRRRWADAAQVRFEWLKAHPPTFEKVSVAEFVAEPVLVGEPVEAEGFEAQRKGIPFDQCPYDDAVGDTDDVDAPAAWRRGWLRADQTVMPVTDDRPKVADVQSFVIDEINAQRQWYCAQNGIFTFEGQDGKPVSIHEYFQTS